MRVKRNNESSALRSIVILLLSMTVLVGVVYYMNPMDSRQKIADFFDVKSSAKPDKPAVQEAESSPSGEAALQAQPSEAASQAPVAAATGKKLAEADAPAGWAMADGTYNSPNAVAIGSGKLFSFRKWADDAAKDVSPDNREQLASLLYEAALKVGLEVGERGVHAKLPAGVNPGFDVSLPTQTSDLKLYNPNKFDVAWSFQLVNGKPAVAISGNPDTDWKAPAITVKRENFAQSSVELIDFSKTASNAPGYPGALIKVYVGDKLAYKDFYEPEAAIMLRYPTAEEAATSKHDGSLGAK
jgi:hypothetical protein